MKLFVGMGNPGSKYSRHRHNVGQVVLERLAKRFPEAQWSQRSEGMVLECRIGLEQVVLLKPAMSMNQSGRSVADAQHRLGLAVSEIFVFYDDVDLAPGRLKVRCGGGSGGHNGVSSFSACIGSEYHRVRIGIGRPRLGTAMPEHVLSNLTKTDELWLAPLAEAVADAIEDLIEKRHDTFLNKVARAAPPKPAGDDKQEPSVTPLQSFKIVSQKLRRLPNSIKQARVSVRNSYRTYRAKIKRSQSQAKFIAVTGSSAKTSTANLIAHILRGHGNVLVQEGHNTFPRTIRTLGAIRRDHDYVVMELGATGPGTIQPMAKLVRPDIAVITTVGMEHYSAFRSKEAVAREKASLLEELECGIAILNADDPNVANMTVPAGTKLVRYGSSASDYRTTDIDASVVGQLPFTLTHKGHSIPLRSGLTGAHNYLAASAAAACAMELGVPIEIIIDRISSFEPVFNRMSVHRIPEGPIFLLDAYKAPYDTLSLSISALRDSSAPRKRFILGGLSDYTGDPAKRFNDVYKMARDVADQVIYVGLHAHHSRATQTEKDAGKFLSFHNMETLSKYIKKTAIAGEVILLKAPRVIHFERLLFDWTAPVRCWETICGRKDGCLQCGLISGPFEQHRGKGPSKPKWYSPPERTEPR